MRGESNRLLSGGGHQTIRCDPASVVRIDVFEADEPVASDQEDCRHRQDVVIPARSVFQVDLIVGLVPPDGCVIYAEGHSQRLGDSQVAVRQQRIG